MILPGQRWINSAQKTEMAEDLHWAEIYIFAIKLNRFVLSLAVLFDRSNRQREAIKMTLAIEVLHARVLIEIFP